MQYPMKLKHSILSLLLAGAVAGCEFLEVEPVTQITAERFWQTASDVEAAVIGCYDGLQNFTYSRDVVFVSGIRSDEMNVRSGGNFTNFAAFTVPPNMNPVAEFWRESYFSIHRCLDVLENTPNVEDAALNKDQALGEAHFIKGLLYFNLVRVYGRIPIMRQTTRSPNQDLLLPRSEVSEVYEEIINDLLAAEQLINVNPANKAFASKGAARALLARVYLHRQAPGDIERALQKCEEVMADNYSLVPGENYGSLFRLGEQNTPETIFMISYQPSIQLEGASNMYRETVSSDFNNPRGEPTPKIIEAFNADPNDLRRDAVLATHRNVVYTRKYEPSPPDQPRVTDVNIIVLRLADVILMRAECLNRLGRTDEAIPFLNQVRTRAGLSPTTATTPEAVARAIEDERFLELAFEGHRYYDLVRTNRLLEVNTRVTDPNLVLWPIPQRDLEENPSLDQNPGY
jgi:starch-binding outer membrane protein, SusD/RagB family